MRFNKWIKIILIFFFIFFLFNYGPFYFTKKEREWRKKEKEEIKAKSEYLGYVNEIRSSLAKEMREIFQLKASGYGGKMNQKIEMLSMVFTAYRQATVQEARALQILAMNQFVKIINAHEKIQPFLKEQPFTYKRIQIEIDFKGPNNQHNDGSVDYSRNVDGLVSNRVNRNKIFYSGFDPYTFSFIDLHNEHYEEALKILKDSPDINPFIHETNYLEIAMDQFYATFVKEMEKNHHLNCNAIGGKIPGKVEEIGANFNLKQHTSQEEARKLMLQVVDRLVKILNQISELKPYFIEYPFSTDRLKLRINFTEKNGYNYHDGSIVTLTLENDKMTYFKYNPEERLDPPFPFHQESYQEVKNSLGVSSI